MYRRPKFLEVLLEIRQTMSREADYDVDLFAEMIRSGKFRENSDAENQALEISHSTAENERPTAS